MKKRGAVAVAAAGVLAAGAIAGGVWWSGRSHEHEAKPSAMCTTTSQHAQARAVAQLCAALRDGGLPELLGVPGERTQQAMSFGGPGSDEDSDAVVHEVVRVGPYTVSLSQHRGFPLTDMLDGGRLTVGGHRADWFSASANGERFWTVEAAWDVTDSGAGVYSVEVANEHAPLGKEETLRLSTAVAEKVMPRLPGWRSQ
ncbi:MAG: hypothetical protein HOV83_10405 [Catenulispora sp.]|nr:hypothetical protein [Catenulispora sp.]